MAREIMYNVYTEHNFIVSEFIELSERESERGAGERGNSICLSKYENNIFSPRSSVLLIKLIIKFLIIFRGFDISLTLSLLLILLNNSDVWVGKYSWIF